MKKITIGITIEIMIGITIGNSKCWNIKRNTMYFLYYSSRTFPFGFIRGRELWGGGGGRLAQAIFPRSGFLNIPKFVFYGGGGYLGTFFLVGGYFSHTTLP